MSGSDRDDLALRSRHLRRILDAFTQSFSQDTCTMGGPLDTPGKVVSNALQMGPLKRKVFCIVQGGSTIKSGYPLHRCYDIERERDPQSLTAAGAAEALAGVLQDLERFDEARALLEESLSIQMVRTLY